MGGLGWGMGYMAPISTLMRWFPDKKGTATGISIAGFAGGAFFGAPAIEGLRALFFKAPKYAGALETATMKTENSLQYVLQDGVWHEAVVATAKDIAQAPGQWASQLQEGVYVVGTGDTGTMMTFLSLGGVYAASMAVGSWFMRAPPADWTPKGYSPPTSATTGVTATESVSAKEAMRTPQFYLLWTALACNASAGVCVIASAKQIMGATFIGLYPDIVTAAFTTSFVATLSVANAAGRLGWAAVSDGLGRKNTMFICSLALPACAIAPSLTSMASAGGVGGSVVPLWAFYGTTVAIVSWYGGTLALVPAYCADLFGPKDAGVIYGRTMTAWAASAIATPSLLAYLHGQSQTDALNKLSSQVTPEAFQAQFNAPVTELTALAQAKTVTIPRLMEIAPPGTIDPTPFLYDSTFYSMCGILAVAAVSNAMITKVDPKHFS